MSRTKEDIERMQAEDTETGLLWHYKPLAQFINERGYKTGIEIGTAYGGLANHLMENCKLDLLITIDPYKYYPPMPGLFDQEDYDMVKEQTTERLSKHPQVRMKRMTSKEFYATRPLSFDFIFIDGLHEYDTIKWECEWYQFLLTKGGALMGHDYNVFEDVNKAVDEFAKSVGKPLNTLPGNIWYLNY